MNSTDPSRRFRWQPCFYTALFTFSLVIAFEMTSGFDGYEILYLLAAPVVVLTLVIWSLAKNSVTVLSVLAVYCLASWVLLRGANEIRSTGRWLLWSRSYKTAVMQQPKPENGELRHMEWYGWGFAGSRNTYDYLVFDPTDSLTSRAQVGIFIGLPCEPYRVRRLERQWYSVLLYTGNSWSGCRSESYGR